MCEWESSTKFCMTPKHTATFSYNVNWGDWTNCVIINKCHCKCDVVVVVVVVVGGGGGVVVVAVGCSGECKG